MRPLIFKRFYILISLLLFVIKASLAHDASLTYTTITIDSTRIELKITIPMETLDNILHGKDWFEKVDDVSSFVEYFNKKFIITNENIPCKTKLISDRPIKSVREYSFTFELTSDSVFDHLTFNYNMIFEYSPTHENIAEFMFGSKGEEEIFSKDKNIISFSVNDLRKQWGMKPYSKKLIVNREIVKQVKDSPSNKVKDTQELIKISDTNFSQKITEAEVMKDTNSSPSEAIIKASDNKKPFDTNDTWKRFIDFFIIGVKHILTGYDHIMFLMGLLLMITGIGNLLKVITAFTIAHSITLAIAVFGIYALPSELTESMIALSISFVAFENIYIQKLQTHPIDKPHNFLSNFIGNPKKRWRLTFFFGLIHGFGFSAALREIGMPEGTRAISLFSFNLGVEAGQLMLVALVFPFLWYARKKIYYGLMVRIISISIGITGLGLVVQRIFFPELF